MRSRLSVCIVLHAGAATILAANVACASAAGQHPAGGQRDVSAPLAPIEVALMRAAIDSLARDIESPATLCLQVLGGPAGPADLSAEVVRELTSRQPVVSVGQCPPTYDSMIVLVDSLGRRLTPERPSGYIDPVHLSVGRPQFDRPGYAFLYARRMQGTRGQDHLCVVQLYQGRAQAHCRGLTRWIH